MTDENTFPAEAAATEELAAEAPALAAEEVIVEAPPPTEIEAPALAIEGPAIDQTHQRLDALEAKLEVHERLIFQERSVDLIRIGPFMNLVHVDDAWYASHPDEYKRQSIYDLAKHPRPKPGRETTPDEFINAFSDVRDIDKLLVAFLAREFGANITVCDIGIQYGSGAMALALFMQEIGLEGPLFTFDPGIASELAPLNFINNGFGDYIRLSQSAIAPIDGYAVMHRELGHSEDNRIVGAIRDRTRGSMSKPVRCVRLSTALSESGKLGPAYVKVDTQGAEPGVWAGMADLMERHIVLSCLEFVPQVIADDMPPAQFIRELQTTHHLYDIGVLGNRVALVEVDGETFTAAILETPDRWTDLALIDKRFGKADELCAILDQLAASLAKAPDISDVLKEMSATLETIRANLDVELARASEATAQDNTAQENDA